MFHRSLLSTNSHDEYRSSVVELRRCRGSCFWREERLARKWIGMRVQVESYAERIADEGTLTGSTAQLFNNNAATDALLANDDSDLARLFPRAFSG